MNPDGLVLRTILAALVGFGFVAPTLSAVLSLVGFEPGAAAVAGILGGLCSFGWVVHRGNWID